MELTVISNYPCNRQQHVQQSQNSSSTQAKRTHTPQSDVAHGPYLHAGDVHNAPAHLGPRARVAAEHVGDDDAGEVDVGDAAEPRIVEPLRERRAPARGHQDLRALRPRPIRRGPAVAEEGEERVLEVGPLRVPLEAVARAAEREELVPVLPRREVAERVEDRRRRRRRGGRHGRKP